MIKPVAADLLESVQPMSAAAAPTPVTQMQERMASTYKWLRNGMAAMAFIFPVVLVVWGGLWHGLPTAPSMSEYYFAANSPDLSFGKFPMRTFFVGFLFAIGVCLIMYKGFSVAEDRMLDVAGIFAICVALFPSGDPLRLHGVSAISMFACLFYVVRSAARRTLEESRKSGLSEKDYHLYRRTYSTIAWLFIILPMIAALPWLTNREYQAILYVEWAAIWVFACYWVVKSRELFRSSLDEKAAAGVIPASLPPMKDLTTPPPIKELEEK